MVASQREVVDMCVAIASGDAGTDTATLARWLESNSVMLADLAEDSGEELTRLMSRAANEPQYTRLVSEALGELFAAWDG